MCDIKKELAKCKVLISFGARFGGFEYAWSLKRVIDDIYGDAVTYIDAISLEGDNNSLYHWNDELGIYKMTNDNWEAYYKEAMNNCETMVLLITQPWLDSQWCVKEFELRLMAIEYQLNTQKLVNISHADVLCSARYAS